MKINAYHRNLPTGMENLTAGKGRDPNPAHFGELLGGALGRVDAAQKEADLMSERLVAGETENLHGVMIAMEKADLSLQLAVQTRNRVIEAYNEIMRMQV